MIFSEEAYDEYITTQVMIPMWNGYGKAKAINRKRDMYGNPIVTRNKNPLLNSRVYTMDFDDSTLHKYS